MEKASFCEISTTKTLIKMTRGLSRNQIKTKILKHKLKTKKKKKETQNNKIRKTFTPKRSIWQRWIMGFAWNYQADSIEVSVEGGRQMPMRPLHTLASSFVPRFLEENRVFFFSPCLLSNGLDFDDWLKSGFFFFYNKKGNLRSTRESRGL